jgi:hypothetical protein
VAFDFSFSHHLLSSSFISAQLLHSSKFSSILVIVISSSLERPSDVEDQFLMYQDRTVITEFDINNHRIVWR